MKRFLLTGATVIATIVGVTAFAIAAPFSPVASTVHKPTPNVAAQYGEPTAPTPPALKKIVVPQAKLQISAIISSGLLPVTMPVEKGVTVRVKMYMDTKTARSLGIKVPMSNGRVRSRWIVIGYAAQTTTKAGNVTLNVRMTAAAKAALENRKSSVRRVPTRMKFTFSKGTKASAAAKNMTLRG